MLTKEYVESLSVEEILRLAAESCEFMVNEFYEETMDSHAVLTGYFPVPKRYDDYPEYWSEQGWNPLVWFDDSRMLVSFLGLTVEVHPCCVDVKYLQQNLPLHLIGHDGVTLDYNPESLDSRTDAMNRAITFAAAIYALAVRKNFNPKEEAN